MEFNKLNNNSNKTYTFTDDQQEAIGNIVDFIAVPFNPAKYIVGLVGAGGTGKTFITKYILNHCKFSSSVIKCTSPTHKACRIFSESLGGKTVDTIQSTFGLRPDLRLEDFDPINPQFNPMSTPKIDNVRLLVIDEASMIPAKLVTYICDKCKEKAIKILFIGDDHQLAPVNEKRSIAFDRCYEVNRLTQIVRQKAGNPIHKLLEMLRFDISNKSYSFIEYITSHPNQMKYNDLGEGFSICNDDMFYNKINSSFTNESYTKNIDMYRIVAYTNVCVSNWNNYIRNLIVKDADKNIITKNDLIMSYETVVDDFLDTVINNSEEYIINDIVNYVDPKYGFNGFLVKFQCVHGGNITKPLFVVNHKDVNTIKSYYQVITNLINTAKLATGSMRSTKWKNYYTFKKNYILAANIVDRFGKILYSRDIDYGFSITAHKSQGSTYDNVFVDVKDMIYAKNGMPYPDHNDMLRRLYVACSRAKNELILKI